MGRIVIIGPDDIEIYKVRPFGMYDRPDEESYLSLLMAIQPLVSELEQHGDISLDPPESYNELTPEWLLDYRRREKFRELFFSPYNYIATERNSDGKYVVTSNGHRRMYIAKKYGLRLPVYVSNE